MILTKKDLKLLGEFIASGYPKLELNYALVGRGCLFATDSRKAIKFHCGDLNGEDILVHKKLLKGFAGVMGKDDIATATKDSITCYSVKMSLDTAEFDFLYPESDRIIDISLPNHFKISSLDDIHFELSQKFCFIESSHLYPLIEHGSCDWYDVFYRRQSDEDMGMVKIVATKVVDEEEVVFYTASIMGREFKTQAKEF